MKILALGDSYTIGEGVDFAHNYPHQLVGFFSQKGVTVQELKIIAVTGWTTYELIPQMELQVKHEDYDLVTLLIGVNNQYRGRSVQEYEVHFAYLLERAIRFARNAIEHVRVLSIPDWGLTPFNTERDKLQTSSEIDAYNNAAQRICQNNRVPFIDITTNSREHGSNANYHVADKLHPSAWAYSMWTNELAKTL